MYPLLRTLRKGQATTNLLAGNFHESTFLQTTASTLTLLSDRLDIVFECPIYEHFPSEILGFCVVPSADKIDLVFAVEADLHLSVFNTETRETKKFDTKTELPSGV